MIGNALRMDIEVYAGRIDRQPLWVRTMEGRVTRSMVARYVQGLHFMLTHTQYILGKCRDRSLAIGDEKLAAFYASRLPEEIGHDKWAENDLRRLDAKKQNRDEVMEAAKNLLRYVDGLVDEHPALFLAYACFCEYFTVIKAPEWLELLEERCGIPRSSMTAVKNHADLDREHAEECFALLDDFITDPKMLTPMRSALAKVTELFDAYCLEAMMVAEEISSTNVTAAAGHVSAA